MSQVSEPNFLLAVQDVALPSDRDSGEHIVASGHHCSHVALVQVADHSLRLGLQLVCHDQETKECQVALNSGPLDLERFGVGVLGHRLSGKSDNTVAILSVPVHDILKVVGQRLGQAKLADLLGRSFHKGSESLVKLILTDHTHALET